MAAAVLALVLGGCGEEKPKIPRSDARDLVALLQTVKRQTNAGSCTTVESTIDSLTRRTEALPSRTDEDIRSSLRDGIANLRELVAIDCTRAEKEPDTDTTETTTTEPETTVEPDTETETTPEDDPSPDIDPDQNIAPDDDQPPVTPPDNGNTDTEPSGGAPSPKKKGKNK